MSRGLIFGTWNRHTFWRRSGGLPCTWICESWFQFDFEHPWFLLGRLWQQLFKTNLMFVTQELRFVWRTFGFVCFGRRTGSFRRSEIISSCESCVCSRKLDKLGQFASCCCADGRGRHTVQCLRVHSCGLDDRRAERGPNWGHYAPRCSGWWSSSSDIRWASCNCFRYTGHSSSRPDVMHPKTPPKTPPKRPPAKTPPVKGVPKKAKATEPAEIKGSAGRVQLCVLCFAHEAWECSLDYVQVRNRLLLRLVYFDGHAWNLPIQFPASTNLLNDLAKAMKALDGKKICWKSSATNTFTKKSSGRNGSEWCCSPRFSTSESRDG